MVVNPWIAPAPQPFDPLSFLGNAVGRPIYSTANLLADVPGLEGIFGPIRDAGIFERQEEFGDQHPLSAGIADVAGWLVPGAAYFKATAGLPAIANLAKGVVGATGSRHLGIAAAEAARWFPFTGAVVGARAAADRYDNWTEPAAELALGTAKTRDPQAI